MSPRTTMSLRFAAGFSLIEVLVALLVTTVGLLGLASLQLVSLKQNHNAYLRGQATQLAHEMAERMRANRELARTGGYNGSCTAQPGSGMPATDYAQWCTDVGAILPAGEGEISVDGASLLATVAVSWDDARGDAGAENPSSGDPLVFMLTTEL